MGKNWYALKVFFNKVFEAEAGLEEMGIETYFPVSL
ncbi:MAG: transcriptional regulator, partial [Bacteroidales bacterium]|nr:transcriptional regulator [Bacteroidales bacterium]